MVILPQTDAQMQCNPHQNPSSRLLAEIDKQTLKFIQPQNSQTILRKKKKKVVGVTLPNFKTYSKAILTQTVSGQTYRSVNRRIELSPEINTDIYGQLIFKWVPRQCYGERIIFLLTHVAGITGK